MCQTDLLQESQQCICGTVVLDLLMVCYQSVNRSSLTNTYCCVYSDETPDDGQYICPKHVEYFIKISLGNSTSRWLLL